MAHPSMARNPVRAVVITGIFVQVLSTSWSCSDSCDRSNVDKTYAPHIDPADFVDTVDNPFFTLTRGTGLIYEGESEDGKVRIEDHVTSETKEVLGVTCTVVRNREWEDGDLIEETYDWYAQDREGNVWYFGEDSREYDEGELESTAGSWEAGVDGAQPGIIMKAGPQVGDSYRQEYYRCEAEDMGEVLSLSESVTVPFGSFENCLKTKDFTPLEPDVEEHKFYCPTVGGLVKEISVKGESDHAELVGSIRSGDRAS